MGVTRLTTSEDKNNTVPQDLELSSNQGIDLVGSGEFEVAYGEPITQALDLETWEPGENLASLYGRLETEIAEAVRQESRIRDRIRSEVFPRLRTRPNAPREAGVYQAKVEDIERVHNGFLFNGQVEACDGISLMHDTLPVTIVQIGVSLVSYAGDQGSWVQRLYRRDLRVGGQDPVNEALQILEKRQQRSAFDINSQRDKLSNLARRGIMTYAERAVLLKKAKAPWRMGHGSPAAYELLTGSGMKQLLESSLELLQELVAHKKFLFVPSAPSRMYLTIGNALNVLEYAIIDTLSETAEKIMEQGHYRGEWKHLLPRVRQFVKDDCNKIVVGVFRASKMAPAHLFYAHEEHAHLAALIAMADGALQEHRGFPMLIDLADNVCSSSFGADTFNASTQLAYVEAGEPYRYLNERQTR